ASVVVNRSTRRLCASGTAVIYPSAEASDGSQYLLELGRTVRGGVQVLRGVSRWPDGCDLPLRRIADGGQRIARMAGQGHARQFDRWPPRPDGGRCPAASV